MRSPSPSSFKGVAREGLSEAVVIETREVTSQDVLRLRLAPGGGAAVRFVPLGNVRPRAR